MQTPAAHPTKKSAWPLITGALVLLLVFAVAVKLLTGFAPSAPAEDASRIVERTKAREDLEAENKQKLETYAWADKAKGAVQIPITRAMELTVAELQGRQPSPAGPIVLTPAPEAPVETASAAAAPETAASPAPAATAP